MIERLRSLATALEESRERMKFYYAELDGVDVLSELKKWLTFHPDPERGKIAAADLDLLWRELFPERCEDE